MTFPKPDNKSVGGAVPDMQGSDVEAALRAVLRLHGSAFIGPEPGHVAVLPVGMRMESVKALLDEYRTQPERRTGTAHLYDLASFIAHVNRHKDEHSVVFVRPHETEPGFTAVLDYNRAGPPTPDAPRFGTHRSAYKPIIHEVWRAWNNIDGKVLSQAELAAFLERRILDVVTPPVEATSAQNALILALGGRAGDGATMLQTARGLRVRESSEVVNAQNLDTGEVELVFRTALSGVDGQPLRVPTCFCLHAPVFEGGQAYALWIRIAFRKEEGRLLWTLSRYRPDLIVRDALDGMIKDVAEQTGLLVLMGAPE
jgi:uncharacterized protein YfdQ (DUF2303 family)